MEYLGGNVMCIDVKICNKYESVEFRILYNIYLPDEK